MLIEQQWVLSYYFLYTWQNDNLQSIVLWDTFEKGSNSLPVTVGSQLHFPGSFRSQHPDFHGLLKQNFYKSTETLFTYDDKINPYKDFQVYRYSEVCFYSSKNNTVSYISKVFNTLGGIEENDVFNFVFQYMPDNYPLNRSQIYPDWTSSETYQYE